MIKRIFMLVTSVTIALLLFGLVLYCVSASSPKGSTGDHHPVSAFQSPKSAGESESFRSITDRVERSLSEESFPIPTEPPKANLISIGSANIDGLAGITGTAESVPPNATVVIVNLSSSNLITTTVDASGAFNAQLYSPPGSSILVKYDLDGERAQWLWQASMMNPKPDISYINPLPGTILYVGEPTTGEGFQHFYAAGSFLDRSDTPSEWAGWAMEGEVFVPQGASLSQGEVVEFNVGLKITMPDVSCQDLDLQSFSPHLNIQLRYLFDQQGNSHPWGNWFTSFLFTPTGLPIEHEAGGQTVGVITTYFQEITCVSEHTFEVSIPTNGSFDIPNDLPDGVYTIEAFVNPGGVPRSSDIPLVPIWYHSDSIATLMPITVGDVAPPRIPWTILGDYPLNGHRGVTAIEDAGHYAMPNRTIFPPHQVVVPRLDERTGEPLVYRLEPGSHWLSATDRRFPNPPKIPLKLPSGGLHIEVHKPDGGVDTLDGEIQQSSVRTPTTPGGAPIDFGTGHIGDLYHLHTMSDAFAYSFDQYGPHVIIIEGGVEDVYGNFYPMFGTYEVMVARILDLDPAQLPSTPYQQGDAFAPGLHVFPPVPAEVSVQLVQMPFSDPELAITDTVVGTANRFGYFQPEAGTVITLTHPGEFKVDLFASYEDPDGTLWAGAMTWGNVVEGPEAAITAHGRRGMDYHSDTILDPPAWFDRQNLIDHPELKGIEVYYPYFSGDIHWGDETPEVSIGDSIHSIITLKDKDGPLGPIYELIRAQHPKARNIFRWPPDYDPNSEDQRTAALEERLAVDEAPLFITTQSGIDPAVQPEDIDMWGYWYGTSERPDVHVREIISEDGMGTAYWRFNDTYGYQIGEPADGDQPGDLKWEFGGVVLRTITETNPINEYAIYSSLWVLLPQNDERGLRITPPFQDATGVSINGGPIMTLLGEDIDMLFLPKGVRPGDVLELGDVIAFSGHVGPPLDSRVEVTITSPTESIYTYTLRANKIGWVYNPEFDFVADEPGRWVVDVFVEHDRDLAYALAPTSNNTGTVLGTQGQYEFYVVDPDSPRLPIFSPQPGFIQWSQGEVELITIYGVAPPGTAKVHYTIHDKGIVMGQGVVTPALSGAFSIVYDAKGLHNDFSMLSLTAHEGLWEGLSDEVSINLLAIGDGGVRANTVTLIGEEVFVEQVAWPYKVFLPLSTKDTD